MSRAGCPFHPRCGYAELTGGQAATEVPPLREVAPGHLVACHLTAHQERELWARQAAGTRCQSSHHGPPPHRRNREHIAERSSGRRGHLRRQLAVGDRADQALPDQPRRHLRRQIGAVQAVDGLDFSVAPRETLGLVGESGCGKTTTGRLLIRLLKPTAGRIMFDGHDITNLRQGQMRPLRRDIQMIFQDPYSSLNPRHTVGTIVGAPFRLQKVRTERGVKRSVQDLLELVGLNPEHYNRYPHEFSGGQRQRIGIARTLALRPKLIVADEPVSALDVSIQAQVVNLLEDLQSEFGLTYVVIAHDLSVVRHISDRVAVMYLGKIVEMAERDQLYALPRHRTRSPCSPRSRCRSRSVVRAGQAARSGSGSWVTCRARSTRRPRAVSTPGAGRPKRSAGPRNRRSWSSSPGTRSPATSRRTPPADWAAHCLRCATMGGGTVPKGGGYVDI